MSTAEHELPPVRGLTGEVVGAAICFVVSAGLMAGWATLPQQPPSSLVLGGWACFALAGGIVLDQRPTSLPGRVLVALGLIPVAGSVWTLARAGTSSSAHDLAVTIADLAAFQMAAVAIGLPWAFRPPSNRRRGVVAAAGATAGALVVLGGRTALLGAVAVPVGWAVVVVCCAWMWWQVADAARYDDRATRRRIVWLLLLLGSASISIAVAGWRFSAGAACLSAGFVLVAVAVAVTRLAFVADFRPLDEHLLDVAVVLGGLAAAALVWVLVRLGAGWTRVTSPMAMATIGALITVMVAAPAALWVRRSVLARRYGNGIISPSDVAVITADLHAQTEPRDLLDKAARMVAAASGTRQVRIVLGEEPPATPENWVVHPLVVGGDRVGVLAVGASGPDGPELRQKRTIDQLLPTVALVARAVGLAVEAEHARRDVSRERDAERQRILGDLHDGLGPVLAGMGMRVQAGLRAGPPPEYADLLADLAAALAGSRTELRRIVSGLTPSALVEGDLQAALGRLVESFQSGDGGCRIRLDVAVTGTVAAEVQIGVYRSVAEGVTNALRHSGASCIDVRVRSEGRAILVDVLDDGKGGLVVPGVGLSSLASRARGLGGRLELAAAVPRGTHLHVELPAAEGARA